MRTQNTATRQGLSGVRETTDIVVAIDIGSARIASVVAELGHDKPLILAAESAASFGIRGGEIVDIKRASEAIRITIEAAADKADTDVKTVIVGLSGDVKLSLSKAAMDLDHERRTVTSADVARLRGCLAPENGGGRRVIHRFDGPYSVGDLHGIDYPEGMTGDKLEMHAAFLSAPGDRLDNLLKAVRNAGVEIECVSLEPMSCSLGALTRDERALGAAVLDLGAGGFRGALWEGGRLRQIHVVPREGSALISQSGRALSPGSASVNGMEGIVMAIARRFRIAPATAERLVCSHGALGESEAASLPESAEVAAVDGLGSVHVDTKELSRTIEELLTPVARSLREGLSGFSAGHAVGVVLTGGGSKIKGMPAWISKRFGGAPTRMGVPQWKLAETVQAPPELAGCSGCSLSGLIELGAQSRALLRQKRSTSVFGKITDSLRRVVASL